MFAVGAALLSALFLAGGVAELNGNNLAPALLRRRSARNVGSAAVLIAGANLPLVGVVYVGQGSLFAFMATGSLVSAVLFVVLDVALPDSLPEGQGAVMSLQSASLEIGGALGAAATGAALALLGDLVVYRMLGSVMPLVVLLLFMAARHRQVRQGAVAAQPVMGSAEG